MRNDTIYTDLKKFATCVLFISLAGLLMSWGFFAHRRINRLAVFTLPPEMIGFYKKNIQYITEASVNPDKRRFILTDEAPRHYIDIDHFGDSAVFSMPRHWSEAVEQFTEDTLKAYGILPWHVNLMYYRLKEAFVDRDPEQILKRSADIGHYIADAHVPLHTTENYDGQRTGQQGIHAFWESRLPELYSDRYNFFVGKAAYVADPQQEIWKAVVASHAAVDSVLKMEKELSDRFGEKKYSFETKGKQTQKVYSQAYAKAYHKLLSGMVERRMRASVKMTGDFWYTAWVDAGQPDLEKLTGYIPGEATLPQQAGKKKQDRQRRSVRRDHQE